jgi:ABC-2 type transport system permease protein
MGRYLRLLGAFARFSLANEMAFRGNFLLKVFVEVLWLSFLLLFYKTIFQYTRAIEGWTVGQYLFFLGCYQAVETVIETFFMESCSEFAELVRSGNLDSYLLRPIDEQFLLTCHRIDCSTAPKLVLNGAIMAYGLQISGWTFDLAMLLGFLVLFVCGVFLAYAFLVLLTSLAVWMMRNQSLLELWWLLTTVMRYPREIFRGTFGSILGKAFWYLLPLLLIVNVPARTLVGKLRDPYDIGLLILATLVTLLMSRWFFFRALRSYRSASS